MSYTIIKTDGSLLGVVSDGTINTGLSSLTLIGRNYPNYGEIVANDMIHMLEHFANDTQPDDPLEGQLWWDTNETILKVYNGSTFKVVGSANPKPNNNAPANPAQGDFWWDTTYSQLSVYDSAVADWVLVGPERNGSGAVWEQILDNTNASHDVLSLKLNGVRTSIISRDAEFTPANVIVGYATIKAGINANTSVGSGTFWGVANSSSYLGTQPAANYWRNNQDNRGTGNLRIVNDQGITVGSGLDFVISANLGDVDLTNTTTDGDISVYTTVTGLGQVRSLYISGTTGNVSVIGKPTTALGVATKSYVDDSFTNSPVLGGIPTADTAAAGTDTTQIATTEFVQEANVGIQGYIDFANTIQSEQITLRANIADPTFTGNVSAPTPADLDDSTLVATTEFVQNANVALKNYVDSRDTLKANIASPTFTGIPAADTAATGTNTTQLATTAFVQAANVGIQGYIDLGNTIQSQQISLRATIADPVFTGNPQAPTRTFGNNSSSIATTGFVFAANTVMKVYVDAVNVLKANIANPSLTGLPRSITMPYGSANTTIATTEFVVNNSGFLKNKIWDGGANAAVSQTYISVVDSGAGSADIVIDGYSVASATSGGFALKNGATAITQTDAYNFAGNGRVATTTFVKNATQWWGGSAKFVSTEAPVAGVNDGGSNDGDFWFQREL